MTLWLALTLGQVFAPPLATDHKQDDLSDVQYSLYILLDDKDISKGVDSQLTGRALLPPYDTREIEGYTIRILRKQGFTENAPGWYIGTSTPPPIKSDHWAPIRHWCPCGEVWGELDYHCRRHRESIKPRITHEHWRSKVWEGGPAWVITYGTRHVQRHTVLHKSQWRLERTVYDPPFDWPEPPTRQLRFAELRRGALPQEQWPILDWRIP